MSSVISVTNTGQVSSPVVVSQSTLITAIPILGGTAHIEYSSCTQLMVDNGTATWSNWSKGEVFSATSEFSTVTGFARMRSSIAGAIMVTDNSPTSDPTDPFADTIVPVTGSTIQPENDGRSGTLVLNHPNTINSLTINLPDAKNCKSNQYRYYYFAKAVTTLNWGNATVSSGPASAAPGDLICLRYMSPNLWAKQI